MPVDYSKWDNIELSDDDDFECHPNVDKASFIRWKQSSIHKTRKERQDKITILKMEDGLLTRILHILQVIRPLGRPLQVDKMELLVKDTLDWEEKFKTDVVTLVMTGRDPNWEPPVPDDLIQKRPILPTLIQPLYKLVDDNTNTDENVSNAFRDLINTLEKRREIVQKEIVLDETEQSKKITTENIKTGFDKTIVTKKKDLAPSAEETNSNGKNKTSVVETIHDPSVTPSANNTEAQDKELDEEADYITYPPAEKFARLTKFDASFDFLVKHHDLACQKYSDEILAEAFRLQMKGSESEAKNCVHQSLILQYCGLLGKDGIHMFFKRLEGENPAARQMFFKDVQDTFARIKNRVQEIDQQSKVEEEKEKAEGLERLRIATQQDGTLALPVGENGQGAERAQVFASFPYEFQKALLLQDVDGINGYLATLSKEEAENVVKAADEVGLLTLEVEESNE